MRRNHPIHASGSSTAAAFRLPEDARKTILASTGSFGWPTVVLCAVLVGTASTIVALVALGTLSPLVGGMLNLVVFHALFTPLHEAAHGNVSGRHARLAWVDSLVGHLSAVCLVASFEVFRTLHARHHRHTNDPARDPDHFVKSESAAGAFLRSLPTWTIYLARYAKDRRREGKGPGGLVCYLLALGALVAAVALWAGPLVVAAAWIGPALLSLSLDAFVFDWLPHHPHESRDPRLATRNRPGAVGFLLTLGQSLHQVHHLFPHLPFYRYGTVHAALRRHGYAFNEPVEK